MSDISFHKGDNVVFNKNKAYFPEDPELYGTIIETVKDIDIVRFKPYSPINYRAIYSGYSDKDSSFLVAAYYLSFLCEDDNDCAADTSFSYLI